MRVDAAQLETVLLMPIFGCRAWDRARENVEPCDCTTCRGGIREGDNGIVCAGCESTSPANERRLRVARHVVEQAARARLIAETVESGLERLKGLTAMDVDSIWYGGSRKRYREGDWQTLVCAEAGRAWLRRMFPVQIEAMGLNGPPRTDVHHADTSGTERIGDG